MSQSLAWWRLLVLACVVACIALAIAASGGQAAKPSATFATVDLQKVNSDYKAMQTAQADFQQMAAKFQARLQRRRSMPYLTEAEQQQLDTLSEKGAQQTDADRAAIKTLTDKASQLKATADALSQKSEKDLTPDDKTKIAANQAQLQEAAQTLDKMTDDINNQLKEYDQTNTDRLMKDLRTAVQKVAEQKGYSIVFNSQIALYAGPDITQAVINELNK